MSAATTRRAITATYAQRIVGTVMAFATTVLIARSLGPDGRGIVAAVTALAAIGAQLSNFGFQSANTFFVARDPQAAGVMKMRSLLIGFGAGGATAIAILALHSAELLLPTVTWDLVGLGLLSIPFAVSVSLFMGLLIGLGQVGFFNASELLQKGLAFAAVLTLVVSGTSSSTSIIAAGTGVQLLLFLVLLLFIKDIPWAAVTTAGAFPFRSQLSYGLRAFVASLLAFLLLRINLIMVQQIAGNAAAGHYSVAMAFFDGIYLLPATVGLILFPKLSAMETTQSRWRESLRMAWATLAFLVVVGAAVAAGAYPLITFFFGAEFAPSVPMLHVLLVAVVFYGLNGITSVFLAACGMPWFAVWVWVPALAANIGLNTVWIPEYGAIGAAWSCAISYLLVLVVQLFYAWRHS